LALAYLASPIPRWANLEKATSEMARAQRIEQSLETLKDKLRKSNIYES
jgi:hypothetical protein